MEKQVWQLVNGEGGWLPAGQIYMASPESYSVRYNSVLSDSRGGINQVYIWRERAGYHGRSYQELDFKRLDALLPDDVIHLQSFHSHEK